MTTNYVYSNDKERAADLTFLASNLMDILKDDYRLLEYDEALALADRMQKLAKEIISWHETVRL